MADSKIVVFQDKQIRRAWMNEQWYFSIADVNDSPENRDR